MKTFIFCCFLQFILSPLENNLFFQEKTQNSLWGILKEIQKHKYVDLTHSFHSSIPHWKGLHPEVRTTLFYYDEGVGTDGHGFFIC